MKRLGALCLSTLCLAIFLVAGPAHARSQSAVMGYPSTPDGHDCFQFLRVDDARSPSGVLQNVGCEEGNTWVMPLVLDNDGGLTATVTILNAGARTVVCELQSWAKDRTDQKVTAPADPTAGFGVGSAAILTGAATAIDIIEVPIDHAHGFGFTYLVCDIEPNAGVVGMTY